MDEHTKKIIADNATAIREKIKGGQLFGYPIDMDDPDAVLWAAVLQAQQEESSKSARDIDFLRRLHASHR